MGVAPLVITFHTPPFSTSMIPGERVIMEATGKSLLDVTSCWRYLRVLPVAHADF